MKAFTLSYRRQGAPHVLALPARYIKLGLWRGREKWIKELLVKCSNRAEQDEAALVF